MRPLLHGDISNAARALLNVPRAGRRALCRRMISEAEAADSYCRRVGALHPLWGNGSLMSAARKRVLADEPGFDDIEYCACFEMILRALMRVSDLLCMSNLAHASPTKEHDDNDDFQETTGRAAQRR